jgi:hypothetical protein
MPVAVPGPQQPWCKKKKRKRSEEERVRHNEDRRISRLGLAKSGLRESRTDGPP